MIFCILFVLPLATPSNLDALCSRNNNIYNFCNNRPGHKKNDLNTSGSGFTNSDSKASFIIAVFGMLGGVFGFLALLACCQYWSKSVCESSSGATNGQVHFTSTSGSPAPDVTSVYRTDAIINDGIRNVGWQNTNVVTATNNQAGSSPLTENQMRNALFASSFNGRLFASHYLHHSSPESHESNGPINPTNNETSNPPAYDDVVSDREREQAEYMKPPSYENAMGKS